MRTPIPGWGIIEYYRRLNAGEYSKNVSNVRLKFPEVFTGSYSTIKGRSFHRWQSEIIEVTEEEATHMHGLGFKKVD